MNPELPLEEKIPNILIIDDIPANLKVLGDILKGEGYKVRPVPNGTLALQVASKEQPDLILLDIMMPDMDGFEVCRRLKGMPGLGDIPVIFISALNDTSDIVKALKSGGVDFITKPFQADEVAARVKTHLQLYRQSIVLREQSKQLQELITTKDKFFSIIAHDLRGPLGGFMGLTEVMADETVELSFDQQKEMIVDLNESARNIFNLLENLLEWSRMQQGQTIYLPETIGLKGVVELCIKLLNDSIRKKEIQVAVDIAADHEVFADTNMLQSVLRNLISNAIKFSPRGGKVLISAGYTENMRSVIVVRDTGIGMNEAMVASLFRLNVNNSRPGTEGEHSTGLGLHLCKEFVEHHKGEIWVESEAGVGSAFFFTIPSKPAAADLNDEASASPADNGTDQIDNLKILIAEDNENSGILIRILTSAFSNRILGAATGTEAVEICRSHPDIDLILMDIKMPGMDGYEATRQIRQFNKEVIIIAQTAFGMTGERAIALAAGCNDYISKPIETSTLIELIKKYFQK
jgi:CheY-like chemotaxis protein